MKITHEILNKYDADSLWHEYIEDEKLDGADASIVMKHDPAPSSDFLHFMAKYFDLSDEEKSIYREVCKVDTDSSLVFGSESVSHSTAVSGSNGVNFCSYVFDSTNVMNSSDIYTCANIINSNDIIHSRNIERSNLIFFSENVHDSRDVYRAYNIDWSTYIIDSSNIHDSDFLYKSTDCSNSNFLGFCKRCINCMFCTGIEDGRWLLFNEEIPKKDYLKIEQEMDWRLETLTMEKRITPIRLNAHSVQKRYDLNLRLDCIFDVLDADFFGWIGTLPNYTEEKFLSLFFSDRKS